jgi:hypothetical protein
MRWLTLGVFLSINPSWVTCYHRKIFSNLIFGFRKDIREYVSTPCGLARCQ